MSHAPVMLSEAVAALAPRDRGLYLDATFGAGGYSRAILNAAQTCVVALDRDPTARALGEAVKAAFPQRFVLAETRFSRMEDIAASVGTKTVDGVVFDLGVSSMQLDQGARGFSFLKDGPLDMRMGREGPSAADLVAELSEAALADIFYAYGEERRARRAAAAVVKARATAPIMTTAQLASVIGGALGPGDGRIHAATRVFQALRIAVNDELCELALGLAAAERLLAPGGRLVVVSFHSLEDRIVKSFMRQRSGLEASASRHAPPVADGPAPSLKPLFAGAKTPSEAEIAENPRARSAKLRAAIRTDAPAWSQADAKELAPRIAALEAIS